MEYYGNNDWRDYQNEECLVHYGIPGMKWGKKTSSGPVRADGSETVRRPTPHWSLLKGAPIKPKGAIGNTAKKRSSGGLFTTTSNIGKEKPKDKAKTGHGFKRKIRIDHSKAVSGASGKIGKTGKRGGSLFSSYKKKPKDTLKAASPKKKRGIRARIAALFGK